MWTTLKQSVRGTVVLHSLRNNTVRDFVCMCDYVPHAGTQKSKEQKAVGPAEITTWPLILAVSINLSLPLSIFLPYASVNSSKGRKIAGPSTLILASHDVSVQQTHTTLWNKPISTCHVYFDFLWFFLPCQHRSDLLTDTETSERIHMSPERRWLTGLSVFCFHHLYWRSHISSNFQLKNVWRPTNFHWLCCDKYFFVFYAQ